jgi:hypothetical protein
MMKRLGTGKIAALASIAESYQAQMYGKREELETARRRARQTTNDELSQQFMSDAEQLNSEIHLLEQDYAEARQRIDNFNAGQAWIQSTMERIAAHNPIRDTPTPDDIRAFPLEERRLLLAASGLRAEAFPKKWTAKCSSSSEKLPKRVEVFLDWALD